MEFEGDQGHHGDKEMKRAHCTVITMESIFLMVFLMVFIAN
jgi:hypothetical protein